MSPTRSPSDALRQILDEAQSELARRLHEACEAEAHGVANESTAEIRRLEDSLLAAAMAAERAIVARRHLQASAEAAREGGDPASCPVADGTTVREFEDEAGRVWRAWPVIPDATRADHFSRRTLGDFRDGWICFEALDGSGRRRLPQPGIRWTEVPAAQLPGLLASAITVPDRRRPARPAEVPPPRADP